MKWVTDELGTRINAEYIVYYKNNGSQVVARIHLGGGATREFVLYSGSDCEFALRVLDTLIEGGPVGRSMYGPIGNISKEMTRWKAAEESSRV